MINIMGGKTKPLKTEFGKVLKEFWVFKSNVVNNFHHNPAY